MVIFKEPEIASVYGALDSLAWADGVPGAAHLLREQARNGNRLVTRTDMAIRYMAFADLGDIAEEGPGYALQWAPPRWSSLVNVPFFPIRKMPGLARLHVRVRFLADLDARLQFAATTGTRRDIYSIPDAETVAVVGTGAEQVADFTVAVSEGHADTVSFWVRSFPDPSTDTLMVEATYGANNSNVAGNGVLVFGNQLIDEGSVPSTWNTTGADQPHKGGHYVQITNVDGAEFHPPAEIVATLNATRLVFYPPTATRYFTGDIGYSIYKLPGLAVFSIAAYAAV